LTNLEKQQQDAQLTLEDAQFRLQKIQADALAQEAKIALDLANSKVNNT
jgi:hypothetical protein